MKVLARKSRRIPTASSAKDIQNPTRDLEQLLFSSLDYEREQLAQQIHNGPFGSLLGARHLVTALHAKLANEKSGLTSLSEQVLTVIEGTISQLRPLTRNGPQLITVEDLENELQTVALQTTANNSVKCTLHWRTRIHISEHFIAPVFRIIVDCVRSAIHRTDVRKIEIHLLKVAGDIVMKVRDDGSLSDPSFQAETGYHVIALRARHLGAKLEVQRKKHGTEIICRIPVNRITNQEIPSHETSRQSRTAQVRIHRGRSSRVSLRLDSPD